jgi:hypothetical protein
MGFRSLIVRCGATLQEPAEAVGSGTMLLTRPGAVVVDEQQCRVVVQTLVVVLDDRRRQPPGGFGGPVS